MHGQGLLSVDQDLGLGCLGFGLVVTGPPGIAAWQTRASQSLDLLQLLPKSLLLKNATQIMILAGYFLYTFAQGYFLCTFPDPSDTQKSGFLS